MKLVKEILYEKFEEEGDPIRQMEIGMFKKIQAWLEYEGFNTFDYKINDDATIDIKRSFFVNGDYHMLFSIPEYIQFNYIDGSLEIINCKQIKSLRGFPKKVSGNVRIYQNGKNFTEKEVREVIYEIGGTLEVLSNRQKAQKQYKERGPIKSRFFHEFPAQHQRMGRPAKKYSKGYNLYKTLEFIKKAGKKGRTRHEILKFRYELVYGPNSYENNTYYDHFHRKIMNINRGWGTALFKNASAFTPEGTIRKLATQREDKTWVLNAKGKERFEEYKKIFEKQ
jgi:hypothetical protein